MKVAVGVESRSASSYDDTVEAIIREAAQAGQVHAIGSCGLALDGGEAQEHAFESQVAIAAEFDLPLILNASGNHARMLALLKSESFPLERTLAHAFEGSDDELILWVEAGCYVSFSGKSANDPGKLLHQAKIVPANRLLVESGAPDEALDALSGQPPRCDQSVFVAEIVRERVSAEQIAKNADAFYK